MNQRLTKLFSVLLSACLLFSAALSAGLEALPWGITAQAEDVIAAGACGTDVTYTLTADGTLTIRGQGEMASIPWGEGDAAPAKEQVNAAILEDGVTSIAERAFQGCVNMTSVSIADSVAAIGGGAFYGCAGLLSVSLPEGLTAIEGMTFCNCTSLVAVSFPSTLKQINRDHAFQSCMSLVSLSFPEGLQSIGRDAFSDCTGLTALTFPERLETIDILAFSRCTGLTSITIPSTETSVGSDSFTGCTGITDVYYGGSLQEWTALGTYVPDTAVIHCSSPSGGACGEHLTWTLNGSGVLTVTGEGAMTSAPWSGMINYVREIRLPEDLTTICDAAFSGCSRLTDISIPGTVTDIGASAFSGCTGLSSVTVPASVAAIGENAFSGCTGITDIYFSGSQTEWEDFHTGAPETAVLHTPYFASGKCGEDLRWKLDDAGTLTVSGTGFMWYAPFRDYASQIRAVVIENGVSSIGGYAFDSCGNLSSVSLPDSVSSINEGAFSHCWGLTSVTLPDSVTYLGDGVFSYCTALESVTLPQNVRRIPNEAFYYCKALRQIDLPAGLVSIGGNAFVFCENLSAVTLPAGLQNLESGAFAECTGLTEIVIPGSVKTIGKSAFSRCINLASLTIEEGVEVIDESAFAGGAFVSLSIPQSVREIGFGAFSSCENLTSLTIPGNVKEIGYGAFIGCWHIISLTLEEGIESIGEMAFAECLGISSVRIPASVTSIGDAAFGACFSLMQLEVAAGNPVYHSAGNCLIHTAEKKLIQGCNTSVIPADGSVTEIGMYACAYMEGLTSLTIPESVTHIGFGAFYGCGSFTEIYIPASVSVIETEAFRECNQVVSIRVAEENPVYHAAGNCLIETAAKTLISGCSASEIPADGSVSVIGEGAFYACEDLRTITIPQGVETIGESAFGYCKQLSSVEIPSSVSSIGANAFDSCFALSSVVIPEGVSCIGGSAFDRCTGLTSVTVPGSVVEIGWGAFPMGTMIIGYAGSYAETWAEENGRAFSDLGEVFVAVLAPSQTSALEVSIWGYCTPGATVRCSFGEAQQSVTASAAGTWSAVLSLTGAAPGQRCEIAVQAEMNGAAAADTAQVVYAPEAVVLRSLDLTHSCYSICVTDELPGSVNRSITYVPGVPLSFRVKVSNSARVGTLYVVSEKNGARRQMELQYAPAEDAWFASGFFDETDPNYVPGVLTVEGVDRNGTAFDTGAPIRIRFLIDPSGYAYEAVQSNVLEGVTAAVYFRDAQGREILWNAEAHEQLNPVLTLGDGAFAWTVPEGAWQVCLYKENYQTAYSEWLDVPPEHTNVYIPMVSLLAPAVEGIAISPAGAEIWFSQYMDPASVNEETVSFEGYAGTLTAVDPAETAPGSGIFYAKTFRFVPDTPFAGTVNVTVAAAENYAGRSMDRPMHAVRTVTAAPTELRVPQTVTLAFGETAEIEISAENAAGRTVAVAAGSANISLSATEAVLDENGRAVIGIRGQMPGETQLTFTLAGTALTAASHVTVESPAHVHVWDAGEVTLAPTCSTTGIRLYTCTAGCGETMEKTIPVDPNAHVFKITQTPATCTDAGYTTYACTLCRYGYSVDGEPALGHAYALRVTPATCTAGGYTTCTCTRCGDAFTRDHTAPIPHADYNGDGACDQCGVKLDSGTPESNCVCGQYHTGPLAGITQFFHRIIYFFKNLFGRG